MPCHLTQDTTGTIYARQQPALLPALCRTGESHLSQAIRPTHPAL